MRNIGVHARRYGGCEEANKLLQTQDEDWFFGTSGTRTRTRAEIAEIAELLGERFTVEDVAERRAVLRVGSGAEYAKFHAATFGTTYSRLAGPARQNEFFDALAAAVEARTAEHGVVTDHPVRVRRCTLR